MLKVVLFIQIGMFGHLSAVQARRLGENVLCHICCACVLVQWELHTESWVASPCPFDSSCFWLGFPLQANGMVLFLQNCKGIRDQLCEWTSKVSKGGFWERIAGCWMKWSKRHFLPCGPFLLFMVLHSRKFAQSLCKQYLLLTVFLRVLNLTPLNCGSDFFMASLHLCRSEMEVCFWQWKMS